MQDGSIAGFNKYSLNPETKQKDDRLALEKLKGQSDLMKADLDNWQVQWGLITANLDKWKAAFSAKANQLDSCQRELGAKAEEVGSLKATTLELESKFNTLNFDFNSLDRLYTKLAAERLAKNEAMRTWDEELEEIETSGRRARMDELENKDAQLYDAKKQIKELNQILLATSSQLPQSPPPTPASSPPYEASPGSKAASPPKPVNIPSKRLQRRPRRNKILPLPPSHFPLYLSRHNPCPIPPLPKPTIVGSSQRGHRSGLTRR